MHYISIKAVQEALNLLKETTGQHYMVQAAKNRVDVYDMAGNWIDGGPNAAKVALRLRFRAYELQLTKE